jgi:hypothetical protein
LWPTHAVVTIVRRIFIVIFRLAHALASSFNFQGRVLKTFYVLTDDKVRVGPRLRPQSLNKDSAKGQGTSSTEASVTTEASQPMETDTIESQPVAVAPASSGGLSLSAKLAAKRKNSDGAESVSKARR